MANDNLMGRRKRGLVEKPAPVPSGAKPGTALFGQQAAGRRDEIKRRARKGDMRVKTAYGTVTDATAAKNKYLQGD